MMMVYGGQVSRGSTWWLVAVGGRTDSRRSKRLSVDADSVSLSSRHFDTPHDDDDE